MLDTYSASRRQDGDTITSPPHLRRTAVGSNDEELILNPLTGDIIPLTPSNWPPRTATPGRTA